MRAIDYVALHTVCDGRTDVALQPQRGLPVRLPRRLVSEIPTVGACPASGRTPEDDPGRGDPRTWRVAPGARSHAGPRPPAGRGRSAVRSASAGEGAEKALVAGAAPGVPAAAPSAANVVDQRVLCGHHGRRAAGGHHALRREPEARLMLLGRRYRLELDAEQTAYAERVGGICRAVWNAALD